ncbi:unnamed protein product, partial [Closterium sp. NIES-53]
RADPSQQLHCRNHGSTHRSSHHRSTLRSDSRGDMRHSPAGSLQKVSADERPRCTIRLSRCELHLPPPHLGI